MRKIRTTTTPREPKDNISDRKPKSPETKTKAPGEKQPIRRGTFMTVREVMRDMDLSYGAVTELIKRGELKVIRAGSAYRVLADSIIEAAKFIPTVKKER